jgi:hypothetical protein
MNKELTMHLVIGTAAVAVIYYLYTQIKPTATIPQTVMGAVGAVGSGDAGWTGMGTSDPTMPPEFTYN